MGRDKAKQRLQGRSLLNHVRAAAKATGWPVRVIRRDAIARCGPLSGIYTALKTSRAGAELFLACDMPFVSPALLAKLTRNLGRKHDAVFVTADGIAGFPFLMRTGALPVVENQIQSKQISLQGLAKVLRAKLVDVPTKHRLELFNINTPADWQKARALCSSSNRGRRVASGEDRGEG